MLIDCSFLSLVAAAAAREIIAGKKWNNLSVVLLILVLLGGNLTFHLEAHFEGAAEISIRVGIAVVVLLISLIGGRIIPSFTRNWLVRENPGGCRYRSRVSTCWPSPSAPSRWCSGSLHPNDTRTGLSVIAGVLHLIRLGRWAGDRTGRERLLLILHVGYAFVPLGFLLNAAAPSAS